MKKLVKEQITVDKVEDLICNACGNSLKEDHNFCGLEEVEVIGCYDSPVLDDGVKYSFSLCEHCLNDMFKKFLIKPHEKDLF